MTFPLHHLVYQSSATTVMSEPELEKLLSQSRAWNVDHELTGILLYSEGNIIQVLEGTEREVHYIFERIAQDYRHTHIVKLSDGPIHSRDFSQWAMGFKAISPEYFAHLQGYVNPTKADYLNETARQTDAGLYSILASFATEEALRL